jgi:hypothetical protein
MQCFIYTRKPMMANQAQYFSMITSKDGRALNNAVIYTTDGAQHGFAPGHYCLMAETACLAIGNGFSAPNK